MAAHHFLTMVGHEVAVMIKNREFSRVERSRYAIVKGENVLEGALILNYVRKRNKSEYDDEFFGCIRHESLYRQKSWLV